jgi:hypothetical protein
VSAWNDPSAGVRSDSIVDLDDSGRDDLLRDHLGFVVVWHVAGARHGPPLGERGRLAQCLAVVLTCSNPSLIS